MGCRTKQKRLWRDAKFKSETSQWECFMMKSYQELLLNWPRKILQREPKIQNSVLPFAPITTHESRLNIDLRHMLPHESQ